MRLIVRTFLPNLTVIAGCLGQIQVSTNNLSFTAVAGGDMPLEQRILVVAMTPSLPETVAVRADGGSPGAPAPGWLIYGPKTLTTPALIKVNVDPSGLTAGKQVSARLLLTTQAGIALGAPIPVNVNVVSGTPQFTVTPDVLRFFVRLGQPATIQQHLVLRSTGPGGLQPVTAAVKSNTGWVHASVSAPCERECLVHVVVDRGPGLPGTYEGLIEVSTAAGVRRIPVVAQVAAVGPSLALSPSAVGFEARAGQGLQETRSISVVNSGETDANWAAEKLSGGNWLTLETLFGSSAAGAAAPLTFRVNAAGLATGTHYGLLRISSLQVPGSPLYLPVMLRVSGAAGPPIALSPAGMVFTAPPGTTALPPEPVAVSTSSAPPILYYASVQLERGTGWLSLSPLVGSASTAAPGTSHVSISTAGLGPGIYEGKLNFWTSGRTVRSASVTLVVPAGQGCVPSEVAVTSLTLPDNFSAEVGDHIPVSVRLTNNCGAPVPNGSVAVQFSNGDRPLLLRHVGGGLYGGHWSPLHEAASMSATILGSAPQITRAARSLLVGSVSAASANQPALAPDATMNNFNPRPGTALAAGTISQVYGLGLSGSTGQTSFVNGQLPAVFGGTTVYAGGIAAPLYYVSNGQINIQIPYELAPEHPHQLVVERDGAYSVTDTILVTAAAPGVAAFADGHAIAQHADGSLVDAAHPARPGETVVIYLVGMGQTNPAASTGQQVTGALRNVVIQPRITLDGTAVSAGFAGLTPFFAGLYQINLPVPETARSGELKLVIWQNDLPANETILTVR